MYMFKMLVRLAILILLLYVLASKPYIYQAQLFTLSGGNGPRSVILLSDRHACPRADWAVAMEQSDAILCSAERSQGFIIVEDAASAVVPLSPDRQIVFAKSYAALSEIDLCCAAISVTNEPRLRRLVNSVDNTGMLELKTLQLKNIIAADPQMGVCRGRVLCQLQENSLLFLALRSARRGIGVENIECRHPEVDRTTWTGLKKLLSQLDLNLRHLESFAELPIVGLPYKRIASLGYKKRVFDAVAQYMRNIRVVAHPHTQIMELIAMEDRARVGVRCFKEVVRSMAGFFNDYGSIYTPIVQDVSRLSCADFYSGAQDLIFSVMGAPIIDLKILKAIYEHRCDKLVIVCAGGFHIESIRPWLEQAGYIRMVQVGSHSTQRASPPVDLKQFFNSINRI